MVASLLVVKNISLVHYAHLLLSLFIIFYNLHSLPKILSKTNKVLLKETVSRCFFSLALFNKAELKPWLSTIAHIRNAP